MAGCNTPGGFNTVLTQVLALVFRTWLKEMMSLVRGEPLITDGTDPEQLMKKHHEFRLQIDRQLSKSQLVQEEGRSLIRKGNFMSQQVRMDPWHRPSRGTSVLTIRPFCQVQERICELEVLEESLQKVWEETRVQYEEELEILMLQRELEQAERWLSSYESSLMVDDGVSPEPPWEWSTWTHMSSSISRGDKTDSSHQVFLDQVSSCVSYRSLCQMFWSS